RPVSDMTSIGCHTNLWNFPESVYHEWVYREGVIAKLAPIVDSTTVYPMRPSDGTVVGVGLHDSSAAVIPYLRTVEEPFALISTGTWCITINPFNISPLTASELRQDCLCYLSYEGRPMKASRLFAGHDHDEQVRRIAAHFNRSIASATMVAFDRACADALAARRPARAGYATIPLAASAFAGRQPGDFANFEEAYHCLLLDIMDQQVHSARLVLDCTGVRKILVDGGFSRNQVYMHLLAAAFPGMEVFAACVPQATAMGAAITIHHRWNKRPLPQDLIEWKRYPV
ncbi:MAG TPA: carbohydrate kinase, partial [Puia sp.]|nr:carbohydrate kinase [Puia sp.]